MRVGPDWVSAHSYLMQSDTHVFPGWGGGNQGNYRFWTKLWTKRYQVNITGLVHGLSVDFSEIQ